MTIGNSSYKEVEATWQRKDVLSRGRRSRFFQSGKQMDLANYITSTYIKMLLVML